MSNMDYQVVLIVGIIVQTVTYIISYSVFIWKVASKFATYDYQIAENKEDIKGIGNKLRSRDEEYDRVTSSIANKIEDLNIKMSETLTMVKWLKAGLEEVKLDLKDHK